MASSVSFPSSATLAAAIARIQRKLSADQESVASGKIANPLVTLGAGVSRDLILRQQISTIDGYTNSNATVSTRLDATASSLTTLSTSANALLSTLVSAQAGSTSPSALAEMAKNDLAQLSSQLNLNVGGAFVFGGVNSGATPLTPYFQDGGTSPAQGAVAAAFQAAFGTTQSGPGVGSITASQMQSYLSGPFAALFTGSSWSSNWSAATDASASVAVAPGQSISLGPTANNPAFQQLAQAYVMLSDSGAGNLSESAMSQLVTSATSTLRSAISSLTAEQANVGAAQSTLSRVGDTMASARTTLESSVSSMESADLPALNTEISQLSTQLQASFELTAQLQNLSLTKYL